MPIKKMKPKTMTTKKTTTKKYVKPKFNIKSGAEWQKRVYTKLESMPDPVNRAKLKSFIITGGKIENASKAGIKVKLRKKK